MLTDFETCLAQVLKHEGGYVDHPRDPGGATKWGVTNNTYKAHLRQMGQPSKHVKYMTETEAAKIYRIGYWDRIRGDDWPIGMDYTVFDASVNSGVGRGPKWMQRALGVAQDGKVGTNTLWAARDLSQEDHLKAIKDAARYRLGFLKGLSIWGTFGRGWARRVSEVEAGSIAMVLDSPVLRAEAEDSKAKIKHEVTGVASTGTAGGALGSIADLPSFVIYAGLALIAILAVVTFKRYTAEQDRSIAMTRMAEMLEQQEGLAT
jgi:lysozyme family protein